MKNLAKFSVEKAITVFMAVIIVGIFGVVSFTRLTTDLFPSMNIPYSVVVTTYIGASPGEVEEVVSKPFEETLATTTNIKEVQSISQENISIVMLEFESDANMDSAIIEMRENLDMIMSNVPDGVGNPTIIKINPDLMPVMVFSVSRDDMNPQELTEYVEDSVLPYVERINGVASVSVSGAYDSEVQVVLNDEAIASINQQLQAVFPASEGEEQFALDKEMISNILMAQNFEFPVGYASVDGVNYLVRVGDEFESLEEMQDMVFLDLGVMANAITMWFDQENDLLYTIEDGEWNDGVMLPTEMPDTPILGSMYFDETSSILMAFDGSTWSAAFPMPLPNFEPYVNASRPKVTLSDIAAVTFVNANEKEYSKVNGDNSITITIQKSSAIATTDVTNEILSTINGIADNENVDFTVLLNQGDYIEQSTGNVVNNLMIGAVLAVFVLILFLRNLRATFIVGVAIPISLLFAIVLIYLSGITLNIVSLGGLALGIGMLVDNSIVVMENIYRLKRQGLSNKEAAIKGTAQVGGAITASTLTTISVFLPIIFIEGFIREIFIQMAMTITFSLLASLMIALTLVPSVSSKVLKEDSVTNGNDENTMNKVKDMYEKVFHFSFKYKFVLLPLVLVLFVLSIGLSTRNGFEYFPQSDEGELQVTISNPTTDPLPFDEFVVLLDEVSSDILALEDVQTVGTMLGGGQSMFLGFTDADTASINILLGDDREKTTLEMQAEISDLLSDKYTTVEYDISGSQQMTSALTGSGIQVQLKGYDLDTLKEEAIKIATIMETVDGIKEVDNGIGKEADELKVTVNKDVAIRYNITVAQVMGVLAGTLQGEEAATTLTIGADMYEVFVYDANSNFTEKDYTVEEIEDLIVGMNPLNSIPVRIKDIADVEFVKGFSAINRVNGSRSLTISAMLEEGENVSLVAQDLEDAMTDYNAPSGYEYEMLGENEEIMSAMEVLLLAVALGIVLIYMIMASQFQSLSYPFIIMFTIPLAFTGGFFILWIANMAVSVVALIGLIILTGVVVNNGIVLVDYTNQLRDEGLGVKEALLEAGKTRLRPIVMTALTTILALTTMAIGLGEGAEMMQPMAVTTIGGLIYATLLTLIIVPIMYYLVTKNGRLITNIIFALVTLVATPAAYMFMGQIYIIVLGSILFLFFIFFAFYPTRKGEVNG